MIVPQNRLLFWTAGGVLPVVTLAAAFPEAAPPALVILAAFTGWIVVDAVHSRHHTHQLRIEGPAVVRLAKGRPGTLPLRLEWSGEGRGLARIALVLPGGVHADTTTLELSVSASEPHRDAVWPLRGRQTGRYPLERIYLEMDSRHRFWVFRRPVALGSELRVYPNLQTEYRLLRGGAFRHVIGIHSQRQVGKGRDFEQLREYLPGDGYEDIHWKATAKFGHPVTKVFQIERTQELYVVLDASRLSGRSMPTGNDDGAATGEMPTLIESFITAALGLGVAAERQGDRFGLLTFSDQVTRFLRAGSGKAHATACLESIYTLRAEAVAPDFNDLFAFIATHLRRRALIVFLTSLDDPVLAESFAAQVDMIRRQHVVLVNMIRPPGARPLFSDPAVDRPAGIHRALAGHHTWHHLRETQRRLQRKGVRLSLMETDRLGLRVIAHYLEIKQRQLL